MEESRDWPVQLYSGIRNARCVLVRTRIRETNQVYDCKIEIAGLQAPSGSRAMQMVDMLPKAASHARVTSTDDGTGPYLGCISDAMQAAYQRKTGFCASPRNGARVECVYVCVCVCARARATSPPFRACQYLCVFTRRGLWLTSSLKKTTQSMNTTLATRASPVVATVVRVINTIHKSSPWTWPPRLGIRARVLLDTTPPTVKCTPMLVPGDSGKS